MKRLLVLASLFALPSFAHGVAESSGKKMILHLSSGQSIRVVARETAEANGGWEYKSPSGWKRLEASAVRRVESETSALATWKACKSAADKAPESERADARAAAARSAIEAGLLLEGLEMLDTVLRSDPDHVGALALVAERPLMSTPKVDAAGGDVARAIDPVFRWASKLPPAARECAVREIANLPHTPTLRAALSHELVSQISGRRSFAALALRRIFPGEEIRPLLVRAVLDPSDEVRESASHALRTANEPGVIVPIVRVLAESESPTSRIHAAEALGRMGYAAAVEPLMSRLYAAAAPTPSASGGGARAPRSHIFVGRQLAYVQDFDVEVAQSSAIGDPVVNTALEGAVLDVAVRGVEQVSVAVEQATIRKSLGRLTGAAPGNTSRDWMRWWKANEARWSSASHSTPGAR
ncbi:MAG: HEAT repeat domain-containing protein [Planctomycetota bacterium]